MNFALVGAMGKMGQSIAHLASSSHKLRLLVAIESVNNIHLNKQYSSLVGIEKYDFPLTTFDHLENVTIDGLIDFSSCASTLLSLEKAQEKNIPLVIGTTGFSQTEQDNIRQASKKIPILLASNMSLGVNLLFWLVEKASRVLKDYSFDPEIMEIHHNQKKDAPSGTSRTLEEVILQEFNWNKKSLIHGRSGLLGSRDKKELGSHSLRGGDVVGEHSVYFFGEGERLTLSHQATNREIFASGALNALLFLSSQKSGFYTMRDVLALT